jgi:hypothetical protein
MTLYKVTVQALNSACTRLTISLQDVTSWKEQHLAAWLGDPLCGTLPDRDTFKKE